MRPWWLQSAARLDSRFLHSGVVREKQVILNPGRRRLKGGENGIVIGTSQNAVDLALSQEFTAAEPLEDIMNHMAAASNGTPTAFQALQSLSEVTVFGVQNRVAARISANWVIDKHKNAAEQSQVQKTSLMRTVMQNRV